MRVNTATSYMKEDMKVRLSLCLCQRFQMNQSQKVCGSGLCFYFHLHCGHVSDCHWSGQWSGILNPDYRDNVIIMDQSSGVCYCLFSRFSRYQVCVFLTFLHHANTQTLLKAAVLAAVTSPLVHRTVLAGQTHILGVFLHSALRREETGIPIISHQTQSST